MAGIPPRLSRETFLALRDLISQWTGVMYEERKTYLLENRLQRRLRFLGMGSFEEYLDALTADFPSGKEREAFIDLVTTHETYFFRNLPQLEVFVSKALPDLVERLKSRSEKVARIWSAACSSGEEPYTLAMMMDRKGSPGSFMEARILGTDISPEVLRRAREGLYDRYSLRSTPEGYLKEYFSGEGDGLFRLNERIRRRVKFERGNLLDGSFAIPSRSMDVVFCRNALIYFDDKTKKRAVENIARVLKPGGWLFIGHSESLHKISSDFDLLIEDGVPLYRRKKR
ncbi:MAG: CheR family methyltransferase [Candidatus Nitrospinota bacterium M3_3B_026]